MYSELFEKAFKILIDLEGGYVDDPNDRGGKTKYGITTFTYNNWYLDLVNRGVEEGWPVRVKDISIEQAKEIYWKQYWIDPEICTLRDELAIHVFVAGVNIGPPRAIACLQKALQVARTNEIDDKTYIAQAAKPLEEIVPAFAGFLYEYYSNLAQFPRYGKGWMKRVFVTLREAK
jgi:lysozyme family protein